MPDTGPGMGNYGKRARVYSLNLIQCVCFTEEEKALQNGKVNAQNHLAG